MAHKKKECGTDCKLKYIKKIQRRIHKTRNNQLSTGIPQKLINDFKYSIIEQMIFHVFNIQMADKVRIRTDKSTPFFGTHCLLMSYSSFRIGNRFNYGSEKVWVPLNAYSTNSVFANPAL